MAVQFDDRARAMVVAEPQDDSWSSWAAYLLDADGNIVRDMADDFSPRGMTFQFAVSDLPRGGLKYGESTLYHGEGCGDLTGPYLVELPLTS